MATRRELRFWRCGALAGVSACLLVWFAFECGRRGWPPLFLAATIPWVAVVLLAWRCALSDHPQGEPLG